MSQTGWTPVDNTAVSGWTPVEPSYATGIQGASIKAPPKVFSSDWFKEKADRMTDYFPGIGATVGAMAGVAGGPVGSVAGAMLGGGAGESARELSQRALGTNFNVPQTSGGAATQIGKEALISGGTQVASEGIGAAAHALAPAFAESALKIGAAQRGYGKTIGKAVLENTSGITPQAVSDAASAQADQLKAQVEGMVHQATLNGQMGSTTAEHQILNDAFSKFPRNAKTLRAKIPELHDLLELDQTGRTSFTPDELLEMKRGIGKEISLWPPEWQHHSDIVGLKGKLYGSIDSQLDRLAPGTGALNQQWSSLIPAISQGMKIDDQASLVQSIAHRVLAHTGALTGATAGAIYGGKEGGTGGAVLGGISGLILPEVLASPSSQMAAARALHLFSQHPGLSTAALQLLASRASQQRKVNDQPENQ
jgi:hypothetical protein